MLFCDDPYVRFEGDGLARFNPLLNRVQREAVACGRCKSCQVNRKQAWSGKLMAEFLTSQSAAFVTLTYRTWQDEFQYSDVQEMLKRFRIHLERKHKGTRVRFFCAGERGDKFGRRHWHMILFFSKPYSIPRPDEGELWEFWPHGWTNVQNLKEREQALFKIRYCVKYAVKDLSGKGERPRCSLKPALGSEYLQQQARDAAVAGVVPDGHYRLPGVFWKKGARAGQSENFTLKGSVRRDYIAAWRAQWHFDRGVAPPSSPWILANDPLAVDPVFIRPRKDRPKLWFEGSGRLSLPPPAPRVVSGYTRYLCGSGWVALLLVLVDHSQPDFFQVVLQTDSQRYPVWESISEVLDLEPDLVLELDAWVQALRTRDWHGEYLQAVSEASDDAKRRAAARAERYRAGALLAGREARMAAIRSGRPEAWAWRPIREVLEIEEIDHFGH